MNVRSNITPRRDGTSRSGSRFRFVTVFGRHSELAAWPVIEAELKKNKIFYSTNIQEIAQGRIMTAEGEILQNVRNPNCFGVIVFVSDAYFRYLDTQAASEKEVLLDHIQHHRRCLCISGLETLS